MKRFFPVLLLLFILLPGVCLGGELGVDFALRGVWVSTVYNLDYPSRPGLSAEKLRQEADEIIMNAADWGLNAIFLQVRPCADALYASEIFPWSAYLSGSQGQAPDQGFDPLAYFVEQTHEAGLQLHAWINPYRVTRQSFDNMEDAMASLAPGHPARSMPECVVFHSDGSLYFNPGMAAARQLIVTGVEELVEGYDIDGVHLDDYFYPTGAFDDAACFAASGAGYETVDDFRRASVNQLIQTIYGLVKTTRPEVQFGVSPFGVWANGSSHPLGSDTAGASSYYDMYADSRTWVVEEMVDYIMPQLYWHIGSREADFTTLLNWWCDVTEGTQVDLYIGLAAYRILEAEADSIWYGTDEIRRQMDLVSQSPAAGVCLFRYGSVLGTAELGLFSSEYMQRDPAQYSPGLVEPVLGVEDLSLGVNRSVLQEEAVLLTCRAPLGSSVTLFAGEKTTPLAAMSGGVFSGSLDLSGAAAGQPVFPLMVCNADGFLFVDILPHSITPVKPEGPVSITQIFSIDTEDGWHQVTLVTGSPVAASLVQRGTAIQLNLQPCKMAVLFEDAFLEALNIKTEGDALIYTLILPRNSRNFDYDLQWYEDRIVLGIRHKNWAE